MNKMIVKLDGRHRAHGWFSHMIDFKRGGPRNKSLFVTYNDLQARLTDMRIWMWDTYGPSCELGAYDAWLHNSNPPTNWIWDSANNHLRIYVTEEVASHIILANVLDNVIKQ